MWGTSAIITIIKYNQTVFSGHDVFEIANCVSAVVIHQTNNKHSTDLFLGQISLDIVRQINPKIFNHIKITMLSLHMFKTISHNPIELACVCHSSTIYALPTNTLTMAHFVCTWMWLYQWMIQIDIHRYWQFCHLYWTIIAIANQSSITSRNTKMEPVRFLLLNLIFSMGMYK